MKTCSIKRSVIRFDVLGGLELTYIYGIGAYKYESSQKTKIFDIATLKTKEGPDLTLTDGIDTAQTVYLNNYIYMVGGYSHSVGEIGEDFQECGPVNHYRYGFVTFEFLRLDVTGTNSSVNWDYFLLNFKLTMGCVVAYKDRYIYYIGGFHRLNR